MYIVVVVEPHELHAFNRDFAFSTAKQTLLVQTRQLIAIDQRETLEKCGSIRAEFPPLSQLRTLLSRPHPASAPLLASTCISQTPDAYVQLGQILISMKMSVYRGRLQ